MVNIDYTRLEALIKKEGKTKTGLCRSLGRPAYYLRDVKKSGKAMSEEEIELLAQQLSTTADYLRGYCDSPERPQKLSYARREIDDIYDSLNEQGQRQLSDYGRFLAGREDLRAPEHKPRIDHIRHYLTAAAAGYAAPIEGEDYELLEKDEHTPPRADFCIDIAGDSMEPYIHDGQRVYVERDSSLNDLDVGIFFVDGDVYCKQFCTDCTGTVHLLSANPAREDANISISRTAGRSLICFGKVILPKKLPMPVYL